MKKIFGILTLLIFAIAGCSQFSEPQGLSNTPGVLTQKNSGVKLDATFASIKENILDRKCISCHSPDSANKKAKEIPLTTETEVLNGSSTSGALVVVGDPNESVLYQSIVQYETIRKSVKQMPPQDSKYEAVTAEEQQVIAAWISGFTRAIPMESDATNKSKSADCSVSAEPLIPEPQVLDYAFIKSQILDKKCMDCHKAGGKAEDVSFGTRNETVNQTDTVSLPIIEVGNAEKSSFYLALLKDEKARKGNRPMPPRIDIKNGKAKDVTAQEIDLIKRWINEGAK